MADNTKIPPLTPLEKTQLEALLRKVEGFRAGPVAAALREDAAERRELEATRDELASRERRASEHLSELRSALDAVTSGIDSLVTSRPVSVHGRRVGGTMRPATARLRRDAAAFAQHLHALLTDGTLANLTAPQLVGIYEILYCRAY